MILIADSGSTKTDWRSIHEEGAVQQYATTGINPYYMDGESIRHVIKNELALQITAKPEKIYFYGAGCSSPQNNDLVKNALQSLWANVPIHVNHDLFAAARSLCQDKPGIACILGTGSNSCLYNGHEITKNVPSLGYILGDEGSGSYLGKALLSAYLRDLTPDAITKIINSEFNFDIHAVLKSVYQEPLPSKFLASLATFIATHIDHPFMKALVYDSFDDFFTKNVALYPAYNQHHVLFTGSIGYHFQGILKQVAHDKNILLGNIVKSPIEGLVHYHKNHL